MIKISNNYDYSQIYFCPFFCVFKDGIWIAFILQAYIHIFSKTSYDQQNFFSNKSWKLSLFTSMLFLARQPFISIIFFFPSFFFFPYLLSFPFPLFSFFSYLSFVHFLSFLSFFSFSLWKSRADEGTHYLLTSNHKVNEKRTKMVSLKTVTK